MFINRLTSEQAGNFARVLTSQFCGLRKWNVYFEEINKVSKKLNLRVRNDSDYDIELVLYDFDIVIWEPGYLNPMFIRKKFFQFMYQTFGEEYKEAYIEDSLKVFDED